MASKRSIATGGVSNFSDGLCRITVLCEKIDTSNVANKRPIQLFSTLVTIPDTGVDLPFDTILGKTREQTNIFDTSGAFATVTTGNEVINERNISLTFANDFCYFVNNPSDTAVLSNNLLLRMLSGDKFTLEGVANTIYKVIGTNGSVKREKRAISVQDFGKLFEQDGRLIVPNASEDNGDTKLQENTVIMAYNKFNITVMLEFMYEYTSKIKEGFRYCYTIPGEIGFTEGDDYNKFTSNVQVLSDVRTIDRFFVDGVVADGRYKAIASAIESASSEGSDGMSITALGAVTFGSANAPTNAVIGDYITIYCKDIGTMTDTTLSNKTGFLVVKKTGSATFQAVPFLLDQGGVQASAGTADDDFIVPIYNFDFESKAFLPL